MSLREMQLALSANGRLRLQKDPPMAGFCKLPIGLRAPKLAAAGAKSPIVSGGYMKYSRFRETAAGDRVRSGLRGGHGTSVGGISPFFCAVQLPFERSGVFAGGVNG